MKKQVIIILVLLASITSCKRAADLFNRIPFPTRDTVCRIIAQSGSYIDQVPVSQKFGFTKIINVNTGRVDSLIYGIGSTSEVDSFFYNFEYIQENVVAIHGLIKTYNRLNDMQAWEMDVATPIEDQLTLDSNGLAVETSALDTFIYEKGVLKAIERPGDPAPFNITSFSYDDNGNLTRITRGDEAQNTSIVYEYDYSATAKKQIYSAAFLYAIHLYEIMGWIPISPHNLRVQQTITRRVSGSTTDEVLNSISYANHVIDENGNLTRFDAHIVGIDLDTTITNTYGCMVTF